MDQENGLPKHQTFEHKKEKKAGKAIGLILLALILMAGAAAGGWWYRDQEAAKSIAAKNQEIAAANQKAEDLAKQLEKANNKNTEETSSLPSEEIRNNIQAAVRSKNYAAMQDYMAENVNVILAASEGLGSRTPAQAVEDMKYLDGATDPWDFALDEETLNQYASGDYKTYFLEGSLVGQSADGKVVNISFNGEGKIVGVFMSANADIL